ncbi:MAG: hypothetical protein QGG73_00400 [Candidatus Hydrogenedentes bacterium]|jgi:hypothetical protein|nr:hypothetical protein [Candidatus Hydrogenedentota bacterium]
MYSDPGRLPSVLEESLQAKKVSELQSDRQRAESPLIRLLQRSAERHLKSMLKGAENAE